MPAVTIGALPFPHTVALLSTAWIRAATQCCSCSALLNLAVKSTVAGEGASGQSWPRAAWHSHGQELARGGDECRLGQ